MSEASPAALTFVERWDGFWSSNEMAHELDALLTVARLEAAREMRERAAEIGDGYATMLDVPAGLRRLTAEVIARTIRSLPLPGEGPSHE